MTGRARKSSADDEERWAEAQSILDRTPTESAAERHRRATRNRWLLFAGLVVTVLALSLLFAVVFADSLRDADEEELPTWRQVTGICVVGVGVVLTVTALVLQIRTLRRLGGRRPLSVLRRHQRTGLLRQVRGQSEVVPERLPLARHLAEMLLVQQRLVVPLLAGLLTNAVGQWLGSGRTWWLFMLSAFVLLAGIGGAMMRRDDRRARRFLAEHPVPDA